MRVEFIKMLDEADLIQWLDAANRTLKNTRHERAAHKNVEFFMDLKPGRKGDDLNNWRPIALLPIFANIVATIMAARIQEVLDQTPDYNDAGFKARFATDDILYVAEQLFERARSAGIPVAVLVADVKQAFDKLSRTMAGQILRQSGAPEGEVDVLLYLSVKPSSFGAR